MYKKIFLSLFITLLFISFAKAETVDEIVAKMNKSKGSAEAYSKVQNWKMSGSTSMMGQNISFIQYFQKPNLFRMEQDMMGQKVIQTYDGVEGWMINPLAGSTEPQKMDSASIEQMKKMNDVFEGPVSNYKEKGLTIDLLGKEDINGTDCFKMKLTKKENESTMWVSTKTYFPVKIKSILNQMGQSMDVETSFNEYKSFDGIFMPTKLTMSAMGMDIVMTFDKIEFNIKMENSLFKKPN